MANYLIIGGHGKIALLTAPLLTREGHIVTSVIRNPDQTADVEAAGAKALVLDVENASQDELADAFAGQDAIVWSAGAGGGNPDRTYAVDRDAAIRSMDAAEQAGVKRYVMVSYQGASTQHGVPEDNSFFPYAEAKGAADEHLRNSGLDWTILGPGKLTLNEPSGRIAVGSGAGEAGLRDTSRGNVAQAIRVALETESSMGQQIEFVDGDEPIVAAFAQL
ncbi:SDR family oxidoreductase [Citricoccus sp. GCM10030269]|uniref:SDR family oxidoreductase n=1 Tax=Citricoccus sp. GCM10030269 TaxID=3273388 RepID=UPI00362247FD